MEFLGLSSLQWQEIGVALAILVGAAVLARLLLLLIDKGFSRLARRTRTTLDDAILAAVRTPLFWLFVFIALQVALNQLSFLPEDWRTNNRKFMFILYLLVGYILLFKLIGNVMNWYMREFAIRTESTIDEQVMPFVRRVSLMLLTIIAFIVLLSHLDVDVSAFVTTLGIGSLAIALAAQAALADAISGFVIITDRPFAIGDRIEILELDTWGDVLDVGIRSTRIRTRDNRMVVVPNSVIGKSLVVNHSIPSTVYRVQTHVGVGYDVDVDEARQIMIEAVRAQDWVMKDRRIEALFLEWGDAAMIFRVRCWIEHYVETRRILDKLNTCLHDALTAAEVDMPFPTQTIYHRVDSADRDGLVAVLREARDNKQIQHNDPR
jgi:small-conductance mechanosensitive channel